MSGTLYDDRAGRKPLKGGEVILQVDYSSGLDLTMFNGSIHPGGAFWSAEDADYRALRQWIAEGAPDNWCWFITFHFYL